MMHHPEVPEVQQATKFWTGFIRHPERSEGSQVVCRLNDYAIADQARNDAREVIVPQAETNSSLLTVHSSLKKAFTLAEVLITLGIIGVVSVLTLPNIMSNYAKKSQVTQLQRTVNAVSSATQRYMLDNMVDSLDEANFKTDLENFITNYLGCPKALTWAEAITSSYKNLAGAESTHQRITSAPEGKEEEKLCGKLPTGAIMCINTKYMEFVVDVNGNSAPNIAGRDLFVFQVDNKGMVIPEYSGDDYTVEKGYCSPAKPGGLFIDGFVCFDKILEDGWKMNY